MIIYIASPEMNLAEAYHARFNEKLNVLISLASESNEFYDYLVRKRHVIGSLIGDSGAFSVFRGNSDLTLSEVIAFLNAHGPKLDRYFNFDWNFEEDSFCDNLDSFIKMRAAGLDPVPVIHNFYNQEIEYYIEHYDFSWIALGSEQSKRYDDVEYAVSKIKRLRPDAKIHLFGRCEYEWFLNLPIDACDITSAQRLAGFGYINYWNEASSKRNKTERVYIGGRTKDFKGSEYHFLNYPYRSNLEKYLLETFALTFEDLVDYGALLNLQLINVRYYADLEKRINAHWD